jgi:hypothetical protein
MAFFKVDTNEENVKDYSGDGGKWLNKSGIYDVIIKAVIVDTTAKGSEFLNLWLEYEGQEQPIYQAMRLTNNDGSPNLGQKLFTKFCVAAGAESGSEVNDPVSRMIPMGKGGEEIECMVLEDFDDTPITIRLQMEYSMYEGKVQQTKSIRNFFRFEDKATASEIVNNSEEKGKQFEAEQEYADKVTYKDGLTEEDVAEWLKAQRSGKKEDSNKKPSAGFGSGKRTFGKK